MDSLIRKIILLSFFIPFFLFDLTQASPTLGVVINEVLPSPEGPDSENEWIEIFNSNNFKVDLSNWKIQDKVGKTNTYNFPKGTKIPAKGFLVLKRPTSKIILNNEGDGLKLIDPRGKIVNEVSYQKAESGKSYNRTDSGWIWSENLTPGSENIVPFQSQKKFPEEEGLAALNRQIPNEIYFYPFLIALTIAIFSGITILILKKNLNRHSEK